MIFCSTSAIGLIVAACAVIFLMGGKAGAAQDDARWVPPPAAALSGAWWGWDGGGAGAGSRVHRWAHSGQSTLPAPRAPQSLRGWWHPETHARFLLLAADDVPVIADPLNNPIPAGERAAYPRGLILVQLGMLIAAPLILISLCIKGVIGPNSFSKGKSKRDVQGLPALVWLACAGMMFYSQLLGVALLMLIAPGLVKDTSMRAEGIQSIVIYLVACGAGALLVYFIVPRAKNAGFRVKKSDVFTGIGLLLLTLPILEAINMLGAWVATLLTGDAPDLIAHKTLQNLVNDRHNPWTWAVIAAAVIGAPIVEELTFRVFLQSALLRATRSHWLAILVSAALFALIHRMSDVPWYVLPTLFTLGVAAGIAFERTGRVLVPIIMHASFNALNVAMVFLVM